MKKDTFSIVKEFIAKELNLNEEDIQLESSFQNDLGADSLDAVTIIMDVEEEYGFSISNEDANNFHTVGDVVNYIDSHK